MSCQLSPRSSERNSPAGNAPAQSPRLRRRRPPRASTSGTATARPAHRPESRRWQISPKVLPPSSERCSFGAEMAVLERGIDRAVARIAQRRRHRDAGKVGRGDAPSRRLAFERWQALARRRPGMRSLIASTSRQRLHARRASNPVGCGCQAPRPFGSRAPSAKTQTCLRSGRGRRAHSSAPAARAANSSRERIADGGARDLHRRIRHQLPQPRS